MKILNSVAVPKNVKGGPLGFFNIYSVAKLKGGSFGTIQKMSKVS